MQFIWRRCYFFCYLVDCFLFSECFSHLSMYFFVRFRKSFARFIWHISDPIRLQMLLPAGVTLQQTSLEMTCVVKQPWALYKLHFYCTFSHQHALLAVCVCMCGYSHEMERTQNMNAGVFTSDVCDDIFRHLLLRSSAEQVHTEILCSCCCGDDDDRTLTNTHLEVLQELKLQPSQLADRTESVSLWWRLSPSGFTSYNSLQPSDMIMSNWCKTVLLYLHCKYSSVITLLHVVHYS